jgi:hypothetical protein
VVSATNAAATNTGPTQRLEISDISPTHPENHPGPNSVTPSICEADREGKQPRCSA